MSQPTSRVERARGRPRDRNADRSILQATLELIVEEGVARLSMEGVAARAGVAKSTVYRRWSSKPALIVGAMRSLPELARQESGNTRADLRVLLEELASILECSPLGSVLPHLAAERGTDAALDEEISRYFETRLTPILDVVARGKDRGDLPASLPAEQIAGLLYGPLVTRNVFLGKSIDNRFIDVTIDAVMALAVPTSSQRSAPAE